MGEKKQSSGSCPPHELEAEILVWEMKQYKSNYFRHVVEPVPTDHACNSRDLSPPISLVRSEYPARRLAAEQSCKNTRI